MIEAPRKPAVHDQVRVEVEIDGKLVGFRAVVVNAMPSALWLGLVKPDSLLERLNPGDAVTLTFHRDDIALVAESSFLSHLGSTQSRLFSVAMPVDYRPVQRRAHIRLDAECQIEYTIVSQSETGSAGLTGVGVTRNLSAGGLQFMVRAPIRDAVSAGDSLDIAVAIGHDAVLAEAEVVRVDDATDLGPDGRPMAPASPPRPPRTIIAVRFVSISDVCEDLIVRHIFSLQRLRRETPGRRG